MNIEQYKSLRFLMKGVKLLDKRKKITYNKKYNIIVAIIAVILLVYISYSIIKLIKSPTDVFVIEYGKVSLEEPAVGYVIREETVVKGNNYQNGLVQIKSEGEKVASGEDVFRYYSNNEEEIMNQIAEIDSKINKALESQKDLLPSDIKTLDRQIEKQIEGLLFYLPI